MSLIPSPSLSPKESALLVLLFSPYWSRVIPLHSWVLLEVLGIFLGFHFCPIRASLSLEIQSTLPPPPRLAPSRGYLPVLKTQIIQKPEKFGSRSCCLLDKSMIEMKYNKCELSIDHSHFLSKIKGLQTNNVFSKNQHNYKKN